MTEKLFQKYRSVEDYASASQEELEQDIRATGFYHNKAKIFGPPASVSLPNLAVKWHTMSELLSLAGVARKTANVVLGNAFGIVDGFTVDTHNMRLSRRFGWTTNTDAAKVEQDLMRVVPREDWFDLSHLMIFHGRAICAARKPLCEECTLAKLCPSAFVRPA